jgi:hypothetical protein
MKLVDNFLFRQLHLVYSLQRSEGGESRRGSISEQSVHSGGSWHSFEE